jgi:hypothetical protein
VSSTIVIRIDFVEESQQPSIPEQVTFIAGGTVPTGGWTNPQLKQTDAVQVPESPSGPTRSDRLADFAFLADKPDGVVTQPEQRLSATARIDKLPYAGVRVWSSSNCIEHEWGKPRSTRSLPLDVCKAHRDQ